MPQLYLFIILLHIPHRTTVALLLEGQMPGVHLSMLPPLTLQVGVAPTLMGILPLHIFGGGARDLNIHMLRRYVSGVLQDRFSSGVSRSSQALCVQTSRSIFPSSLNLATFLTSLQATILLRQHCLTHCMPQRYRRKNCLTRMHLVCPIAGFPARILYLQCLLLLPQTLTPV